MIENASIELRQNYNFDAFSTLHTRTFENDRIARSDVSWTLCAGYKDTRLRYFRSSFSFWCVFDRFRPSTLIRYECVFKVTHFQERFQIDAFSMKTLRVLVWTESLNVSNVCVLKGKRASVERAYVQHLHFRYSTQSPPRGLVSVLLYHDVTIPLAWSNNLSAPLSQRWQRMSKR